MQTLVIDTILLIKAENIKKCFCLTWTTGTYRLTVLAVEQSCLCMEAGVPGKPH